MTEEEIMMKKLTTEEKAKAYDEFLERAKQWRSALNVDKTPIFANRVIEELFPELKENENERLKKQDEQKPAWNLKPYAKKLNLLPEEIKTKLVSKNLTN